MAVLEDDATNNVDAFDVLRLLSLLGSSPIPMKLFEHAWCGISLAAEDEEGARINEISRWHISRAPGFLVSSSGSYDNFRLVEACATLQSLALITVSQGNISVHPLIRVWLWRRQKKDDMEAAWLMTACSLSLSLNDAEALQRCEQEIRPHIRSVVTIRWEYGLLPNPDFAHLQIFFRCAEALDDVRADGLALRCLEEIVDELEARGDSVTELHIEMRKLWARSCLRNGRICAGVGIWESVLAVESALSEDDPSRLASEHALAGAYEAAGQVGHATRLLEHVVSLRSLALRDEDPSLLASQHELARMYETADQAEAAIRLLEHVVSTRKDTLPESHSDLLSSQHALGAVYAANGRIEEAIHLLEHVVGVRQDKLTEEHPDRLASQHELARAYESHGQAEKAVQILEFVVEVEAALADDNPDRLDSQHVLARLYRDTGSVDRAVELFEHVLRMRKRNGVVGHPSQQAAENELSKTLELRSRLVGRVL